MLNRYPVNPSITARKQNCFIKSWYNINPCIEYSQNLAKVFYFACSLFGSKIGCSEDMWQNEGLNQWDKMKRRGKQIKKARKKYILRATLTSKVLKSIIRFRKNHLM